jgi:hypothetical protein
LETKIPLLETMYLIRRRHILQSRKEEAAAAVSSLLDG